MVYKLTEEEYKLVQHLSDLKDYLDHMMNKEVGYFDMSDLIAAYRSSMIKIVEWKQDFKGVRKWNYIKKHRKKK